jgi:hypothetical protein
MRNSDDERTALLLIDVQKGVDVLEHWGGPSGRRNNPDAETHLRRLLDAWRQQLVTFRRIRSPVHPLRRPPVPQP